MSLKEKLEQASKKAEAKVKERRTKTIQGAHLNEKFLEIAREAGVDVRENTGFYVLVGKAGKSNRIYVAKRGGIVDLLGFTVHEDAVLQVSREMAKEKHMGRVYGRIRMEESDEAILSAYRKAIGFINDPANGKPEKVKKERKPKEPKTEVKVETTEVQPTA